MSHDWNSAFTPRETPRRTLRAWRATLRSFPTPIGTGSGTHRSRPSGPGWSTCSTVCCPSSTRTRPTPTSCSTVRWRWSTTTSRCARRLPSGCGGWRPRGRLSMGPWYILMDEFLVSGECMVRNLQLGLERAAAFGGAMPVGYLPDMFGHVAQMPQLLTQFGFDQAVVWRGVPSDVDRTAFWWRAPDGSEVRAEYLPTGYGNGAIVPDDAKALVERIDEWADLHDDLLGGRGGAPILWMNGTDHLLPQPWLGRVVDEANRIQDDYRLEVTSLAAYLAEAPTEGLPSWEGELRSGARANLLMGVASNRVDVKVAAARAERELERLAEPLAALFLPAERWPGALLDLAWKDIIRNSAHDSICACSHDEVGLAVLHRFAEATRIAEGITERALVGAGERLAPGAPVVVNPSAATPTRSGRAVAGGSHGCAAGRDAAARGRTGGDRLSTRHRLPGHDGDPGDGVAARHPWRRRARPGRRRAAPHRPDTLRRAGDPCGPAPARRAGDVAARRRGRRGRAAPAPATGAGPRRRGAGLRLAPVGTGRLGRAGGCRRRLGDPRQRKGDGPARSRERHVRDRRARGTGAAGRRRRRRRHLQLLPARRGSPRRPPDPVRGRAHRSRAVARPHRPAGHVCVAGAFDSGPPHRRAGDRGAVGHRAASRRAAGAGRGHDRQPVPRPSSTGVVPAARAGRGVVGRVRVRHRRAGADRRGRGHRGRHADLPLASLRAGGRADNRPRGSARVRVGRH